MKPYVNPYKRYATNFSEYIYDGEGKPPEIVVEDGERYQIYCQMDSQKIYWMLHKPNMRRRFMGKRGVIAHIREWIGGIGWDIFIWSINMTEDEYFKEIYEQEKKWGDPSTPTGERRS